MRSFRSVAPLILVFALLAGFLMTPQPALASGALWLCNDGNGTLFKTDTTGTVLASVPGVGCSGAAFDGTFLYISNFPGDITRRTAGGTTVLASGFIPHDAGVCCAEDLAFDTSRGKLWRIDHSNGVSIPSKLRRIDPVSLLEEAVFSLPLAAESFTDLGGIGLAYDPVPDLLYASFCHAGCSSSTTGIVLKIDPNTGTNLGTLFTSNTFATFGLGYDFVTGTLWMGSFDTSLGQVVRHMTLAGAVLSTFPRPPGGGVVDGLEFIDGFAGTPGQKNCHGKSVAALVNQFGGLNQAAAALGYPTVQALQDAIQAFCKGCGPTGIRMCGGTCPNAGDLCVVRPDDGGCECRPATPGCVETDCTCNNGSAINCAYHATCSDPQADPFVLCPQSCAGAGGWTGLGTCGAPSSAVCTGDLNCVP
jgi:hypothetical protein